MKIKRCPFCGSKEPELALADEKISVLGGTFVLCKCGVTGPLGNTDKKAIKKWNRRFKE